MEIWGIGCLDNDVAVNWAFQLIECEDLSIITSTLDLAKNTEPMNADDACKVLAAIETIAKLKGETGDKTLYSKSVDEWVKNNPMRISQTLINESLQAIETITKPETNLLAKWEMKDGFIDWMNELGVLRDRLLK
jgi:hypothetical protein